MRIEIYTKSSKLPPLIEGNIEHSRIMFATLEKSSSSKPYMLVAYENNEEQAHLIIIRRRGVRLLPPVAGFWYTIYGEGVYNETCKDRERIYALFIDKIFDMFDIFHSFIEIKAMTDPRFAYAILSRYNFIPVRDHRLYISLHSRTPEERLSRSYRSHIRNATKRGVTYNEATTPDEIEKGLHLLKNYYKSKIRRSLPDISILRQLLTEEKESPHPQAKMFVVKSKGRIIGCSICTYDKDRAYLAYSCGLRKSYPLHYPGIMAVWAAISHARENGYTHIEFLESRTLTGLHSGFKNFLLNFGCKQVSTLRWYHFKWNFLNKILRAIYV